MYSQEARVRGTNKALEKVERKCVRCGGTYYVTKLLAGRSMYCENCRREVERERARKKWQELKETRIKKKYKDREKKFTMKPREEWGWVKAQFTEEEVRNMLRMNVFDANEVLIDGQGRCYRVVMVESRQKLVEVRG